MNIIFLSQVAQIIISVLLVVLVLIQSKGKGLASAVGSSIGFYTARRGIEKIVFISTVICSILLVFNSLLMLYLR